MARLRGAALLLWFVTIGARPALPQGLDSLRVGQRVRISLAADSTVQGRVLTLWPPDSLQLRQALTGIHAVLRRDAMGHLDVGDNHGMTGVYLGLAVGAVAGYVVCLAYSETGTVPGYAVIPCVGVGVAVFLPVFGVVGSWVPRWRRVF